MAETTFLMLSFFSLSPSFLLPYRKFSFLIFTLSCSCNPLWDLPHIYRCEFFLNQHTKTVLLFLMRLVCSIILCEILVRLKLTTRKPCRASHLSCMSPAAPQCGSASACGRCWPPSSDLKTHEGKERGRERGMSIIWQQDKYAVYYYIHMTYDWTHLFYTWGQNGSM